MVVALLLLMLAGLRRGVDLRRVAAISGSAQQHGSVYWSRGAAAALAELDPARDLAPQLAAGALTVLDGQQHDGAVPGGGGGHGRATAAGGPHGVPHARALRGQQRGAWARE
ncbi:unnamed protein product [Urochloa humidicola]